MTFIVVAFPQQCAPYTCCCAIHSSQEAGNKASLDAHQQVHEEKRHVCAHMCAWICVCVCMCVMKVEKDHEIGGDNLKGGKIREKRVIEYA